MEFAGAFGAGKEKGARSVGLGRVGWSWRERLEKQLSDNRRDTARATETSYLLFRLKLRAAYVYLSNRRRTSKITQCD